jgi:hypothetical protein
MAVERPLIGFLYLHFKGKIYVIRGFSHDEKTDEEYVIYNDTTTGKVYHRKLVDFFEPHPVTGVLRFRLVTPKP